MGKKKATDVAYLRKAIIQYFEENGYNGEDLEYWLRAQRDDYDNQHGG